MPSTAEAFGLMALEAMAAGRPVICFEGTALPAITRAPDCGIAVPMGDSTALRAAINGLSDDPREAKRRGTIGREIARRHHSHDGYLDSLERLYNRPRNVESIDRRGNARSTWAPSESFSPAGIQETA